MRNPFRCSTRESCAASFGKRPPRPPPAGVSRVDMWQRDTRSPILDECPARMSKVEHLRMENLGEDFQALHDARPWAVEELIAIRNHHSRSRLEIEQGHVGPRA